MRLEVRVTPRAAQNAVGGADAAGRLRVRVTAAPADGQANAAVVSVLAKSLGVGSRALRLASGAASRNKVFEVDGDEVELRRRLAALAAAPRVP